jgi:hypothetical protein
MAKTTIKDGNPKDIVGVKKVSLHYVPTQVMMEISLGMLEGGLKYGSHNYRSSGVRSSVYFDALMRHIFAWWEGEEIDPDSGINHVSKALSSLVVLRDAMMNDMLNDDRPIALKAGWVTEMNKKASEIIEKYPTPKAPFVNKKKH